LGVHEAGGCVIPVDQVARLRVVQRLDARDVAVRPQLAGGVARERGCAGRQGAQGRNGERIGPVEVPVFLGGIEGQMGLEEPDREEPGLGGIRPRGVQPADRFVGDHAVAVSVVGHRRALSRRSLGLIGNLLRRQARSSGANNRLLLRLAVGRQCVSAAARFPGRHAP